MIQYSVVNNFAFVVIVAVTIADWAMFYAFNRDGLSTNRLVLLTSLVVLPLAGLVTIFAGTLLVFGVCASYLWMYTTNGWTFAAIDRSDSICNVALWSNCTMYTMLNVGCFLDTFFSHFFDFAHLFFRPQPGRGD